MITWIKNNEFLKKLYPGFYEKVISQELYRPNLNISDYGDNNLMVESEQGRCYLHSIYNVEREMEKLFQDASDAEQILIIFGLGMGHCLDYIQKKHIRYRRVIILEPYNNIIRELIRKRDLVQLLTKKDIALIIFKDVREIIPTVFSEVMNSSKVKFVYHISYRSIFNDVYLEISRIFSEEKLAFTSSLNTINYFISEWTGNQVKSIAQHQESASIFHGKFKNLPAIVISAGPSLENRIQELNSIKDRALLIAPGSSIRICKDREIPAHVAVAIDSQRFEADLVADSKIPILAGSYRLHPEVDKSFPNTILRMLISNDFIAQYYRRYFDLSVDVISDFSSVSCSAINYAMELGCNPIILVGQDLCYYDNQEYAGGLNAISAGEDQQEALDINGNLVYTNLSYIAIRRDLEILNLKYQNTHTIINASEAGLGIPGVPNMKLSEAIASYIENNDINVSEIIKSTLSDSPQNIQNRDNSMVEFYRHILSEIDALEKINDEKMTEIVRLFSKGYKENRLNSELYHLAEKNEKLMSRDFYNIVVLPILERFLVYYRAGINYNYESKQDDPSAQLNYEKIVYDITSKYLKVVKDWVKQELSELTIRINSRDEKGLTLSF